MPADLAVLGLGHLGLPAAQAATAAAIRTVGFTPDPRVAAELNAGRPPAEAGLAAAEVRRMLARGFTATSDPSELTRVRCALICASAAPMDVPAETRAGIAHGDRDADRDRDTDRDADRDGDARAEGGTGDGHGEAIREAARVLAPRLRTSMLVVLESPACPGTTGEVLRPLLEAGSRLRAGRDFHLACAPAGTAGRLGPASRSPRVIGGLTPACTEAAAAFYGRLTDRVVRARGLAEAEAAQMLLTNARHVNTALVNEMVVLCHELGIDVWDVLRCAEARPWPWSSGGPGGSGGDAHPARPGPAAGAGAADPGGPVDPGGRLALVAAARRINARMPRYVTRRAAALLNEHGKSARGAHILLLGVTGQPDLPDHTGPAGAPAREVAARLLDLGGELIFHDPYVPRWRVAGRPVTRTDSPYEAAAAADLTLLLQHHSVYDLQGLAAKARLLLDTRGATPAGAAHRL